MRLFGPPFSLRLGHASALTVHRTVIHYLVAASLPRKGRLKSLIGRRCKHSNVFSPAILIDLREELFLRKSSVEFCGTQLARAAALAL